MRMAVKPIPPCNRCLACGEKYRQDASGFCRGCAQRIGGDLRHTQDREREALERQRARRLTAEAARPAAPTREVTIAGQTYLVIFDGS